MKTDQKCPYGEKCPCSFYLESHYNKPITLITPQTTRITIPLTFPILEKDLGDCLPSSITESSLGTRCYIT